MHHSDLIKRVLCRQVLYLKLLDCEPDAEKPERLQFACWQRPKKRTNCLGGRLEDDQEVLPCSEGTRAHQLASARCLQPPGLKIGRLQGVRPAHVHRRPQGHILALACRRSLLEGLPLRPQFQPSTAAVRSSSGEFCFGCRDSWQALADAICTSICKASFT